MLNLDRDRYFFLLFSPLLVGNYHLAVGKGPRFRDSAGKNLGRFARRSLDFFRQSCRKIRFSRVIVEPTKLNPQLLTQRRFIS